MGSPQQAMPFRLAHSSLQLALRFWPEETRDWGHALAAELDEIEKPLVALQWAFGGLMLFSRASASHFLAWLKLPAGSRLSTAPLLPGTSVPILPKRSRLFTAVILLAAALLLFLPQSRQAISTVVASWNGYEISSGDRRTLANLAAQAEKDRDARTLAFVALVLRDPEQGMRLADKAVVLDPQLTWVYASRFYRPADVQQPTEWLVRLHASDPDNSVTDLLIADNIAQPRYMALMALGTPGLQQFESQITGDPRWVAHMEAAFRAPRYDGYVTKHWELISYVWSSHPTLSPSIIGYELWAHRIPNLSNLMSFANFKIRRAQQALAEGHPEEAEQILRQIDAFGNLMTDRAQTDIECLIGLDLSRKAARELGAHYAATGQEAAAKQASVRVEHLKTLQQTFHRPSMAAYLTTQKAFRGNALLFQVATVLLLLSALMVVFSHLGIELQPRSWSLRQPALQRMLCRAADYSPVSLLFVFAGFVLSFLPFARLFAEYRAAAGSTLMFRQLSSTLWELVAFPSFLQGIIDRSLFWWFLIAVLALLAMFILVRGFYRGRPGVPTAA
jgi:hypothetical protein